MRKLLQRLCTDSIGSSISTEMALVTSVTLGALVTGMAEFSAIVNREFEHAVANTTLLTIDDVTKEKKQEEAEGKAEEEQEKKTSPSGWRFRRAEDREEETGDETGKGTRSGDR